MKSDDYMMVNISGESYERITHVAGVKTTICKNRFEIACADRSEINEQQVINELRTWISKRRVEEMRSAGDMPVEVS